MKAIYINGEKKKEEEAIEIIRSSLTDDQCFGICKMNLSHERAMKMTSEGRRDRASQIALNKFLFSGWVQADDKNCDDDHNWLNDEALGLRIEYKEVKLSYTVGTYREGKGYEMKEYEKETEALRELGSVLSNIGRYTFVAYIIIGDREIISSTHLYDVMKLDPETIDEILWEDE